MKRSTRSLAQFAAAAAPTKHAAPEAAKWNAADTKSTIFRLTPEQWRRLKDFALDEGKTMQSVILEALSRHFQAKGQPPL